jgi:hypothetical protein
MRESEALRGELNGRGKGEEELQCPFYPDVMFARVMQNIRRLGRRGLQSGFLPNLSFSQLGVLLVALLEAGYPEPWEELKDASKRHLESLLGGLWKGRLRGDKEKNPVVVIEEGAPEFDPWENCWRVGQLEPFELGMFKGREHSGRKNFLGFIRIDSAYNEKEAVDAFRAEYKKYRARKRGGGGANWRGRLSALVAMRIWKGERDPRKRLKQVAEYCGYKGCVAEAAAYKERCKEGHCDEPISEIARVELSRARARARKFFQELFPGEEPLSY